MKWILFYLSIILATMVVCGSNVDSMVGSPAPNLKYWRLNRYVDPFSRLARHRGVDFSFEEGVAVVIKLNEINAPLNLPPILFLFSTCCGSTVRET